MKKEKDKVEITEETKNAFQWLLSELFESLILLTLGHDDIAEEKLTKVLLFSKQNGITECSMALEEDIDKEGLINLINKFKQD